MMKATLIRVTLITLTILCCSNQSFAESKTFIREYSYQASELDSKVSCRAIALELVKRLLLEEAGTYLESETEVRNYQLTKDQITVLTAGIVKAELLNEKWDGKTYYIQAKLEVNPKEVEQSIQKLRQDKQKTKELEETKIKVNALLQEIDELKKKVPSEKVDQSKSISYRKAVDKLRAMELNERAVSQMHNSVPDEEVIGLFSEVIELDPTLIEPYYWRASTYARMGSQRRLVYGNKDQQALTFCRKALKDYDKIVQLKPQNYFYAWALSGRGHVYQVFGDYKRAINDYSEAIRRDHKNYKHYNYRSSAYSSMGEYEKAYADITKAIELNKPSYGFLFYINLEEDRGDIAFKLKNYEVAIADYSKTLSVMESNVSKKRDSLCRNGIYKVSPSGQIVEECPGGEIVEDMDRRSLSLVYFKRGQVYAALGSRTQAIFDFSKSIDLFGGDFSSYFCRGQMYFSEGKYELAVSDFSKALNIKGVRLSEHRNNYNYYLSEAYYGRGYARIKLGQHEQGMEDMKVASRLNFKLAQDHLTAKGISWKQ